MSKDFTPPEFDKAAVLAGLHIAMGFGTPTRTEDRATFFVPREVAETAAPSDISGVPFSPTIQRVANLSRVQVACVVDFFDAQGVVETFGTTSPTRIKLTLLDAEWQQVKEFSYVVAGGDKYIRAKVQPPIALGTIDVWEVWANAENER